MRRIWRHIKMYEEKKIEKHKKQSTGHSKIKERDVKIGQF